MADNRTQDLQLAQVHITTGHCLTENIIARVITFRAALPRNHPCIERYRSGIIRLLSKQSARLEAMLVRVLRAAAAQMGPTQKADSREHTLGRMLALLEEAAARGASLVVFPELAFTTFFPRWLIEGEALDHYFERGMPNPAVQPLFDRARALGIGFYVGYAELTSDGQRFNCSILVDRDGEILGRYRKVHLPGSVEPRAGAAYQQLEKRYFEYGDLGFPAFRAGPDWRHAIMGMMICNDRRWPEAWRVLGLQGVELVCVGYNSAAYDPNRGVSEDAALRTFHSRLVTQANAYMNATWAIAVAKAGNEEAPD